MNIQLSCHSSSTGHYFTRGSWLLSGTIAAKAPRALFYNLFCCSGTRFTDANCLGAAYIFNGSSSSLTSIGSTKTGSMLVFDQFYTPLGTGKSVGESFRLWFAALAPYSQTEIYWHYGMNIIGDPMVTPLSPPAGQDSTIPTLSEGALLALALLLVAVGAMRLRRVMA